MNSPFHTVYLSYMQVESLISPRPVTILASHDCHPPNPAMSQTVCKSQQVAHSGKSSTSVLVCPTALTGRLFRSRRLLALGFVAVAMQNAAPLFSNDWPSYRSDASRSGVNGEQPSFPLVESWTWSSSVPPDRAWPGPARKDLYNKVDDLRPRMIFDRAFEVAIVDDGVYFGTSTSDQVVRLNTTDGRLCWTYFAEGPVRFAPAVADGHVYFGSDDGHVYSVDKESGELAWKVRIGPQATRLPGNGRIISKWPVRTGVLVKGDDVHAAAGMFPNDGVFVVSLDRQLGTQKWETISEELPAQGYLLASEKNLYVPTGRNNPMVFSRSTGKYLEVVSGQGGTYAQLYGDSLMFGPGKSGLLRLVTSGQPLLSFSGNQAVIAADHHLSTDIAYILGDNNLSSFDLKAKLELADQVEAMKEKKVELAKRISAATKEQERTTIQQQVVGIDDDLKKIASREKSLQRWQVECDCPYVLILAGDTLFAGGQQRVAAFDIRNGQQQWHAAIDGRAYGLAFANSRLFVSSDLGAIHCFAPSEKNK